MSATSHTSREYPYQKDILQFRDGTQIVNPRFFYKIYEGYGFAAGHRFTGVASDAYVEIYFENPPGSGRKIYIITVTVTALDQAWIDIYRGNTVETPGTQLTPVNLNFEKNIPSVARVEYGGVYTLGTLALDDVCPGGSKKEAVGGRAEVGEVVIIPEGYNFLTRVTNKSASATDIGIRIIWWEEPI